MFRVPYNPESAFWLAGGAILLSVPWIIDAYQHKWAIDKVIFAAMSLVFYAILALRARRVTSTKMESISQGSPRV